MISQTEGEWIHLADLFAISTRGDNFFDFCFVFLYT